jgi:hypothetical protein
MTHPRKLERPFVHCVPATHWHLHLRKEASDVLITVLELTPHAPKWLKPIVPQAKLSENGSAINCHLGFHGHGDPEGTCRHLVRRNVHSPLTLLLFQTRTQRPMIPTMLYYSPCPNNHSRRFDSSRASPTYNPGCSTFAIFAVFHMLCRQLKSSLGSLTRDASCAR